MQNWEVVKKKISEMNKEEIIKVVDKLEGSHLVKTLFDIDYPCKTRNCYKFNYECKKCMRAFWEEEYQPPKQEKWVVHRTLRTKNKESYVGYRTHTDYDDVKCGYTMVYKKEYAKRYDKSDAIMARDELNKDRVGKQYLWVISRVEE